VTILVGDCREVMQTMEPESVDAIVTDPPYGLEFMGKEWDKLDHGLPQENVWKGRRWHG
jgi:DNA modification methylase